MAAAILAPGWPVFGLTRRPLQVIVALYLIIVGMPLLYLPSTVSKSWLAPALAISGAIGAAAVGAAVSTRLAQLEAIAAAAFAGAAVAGRTVTKARASDRAMRSLIAVFAVLCGGVSWLASVEPDPPQTLLLAGPFLPALLWLSGLIRLPSAGAKIS
jgi:hypothetical protein